MMSANYEGIGLGIFATLSLLPVLLVLLLAVRWWRLRNGSSRQQLFVASLAAVILHVAVCVDAFWIEPNWPRLTRLQWSGPLSHPLRILHLSDLHIEKDLPSRERWLIQQVQELKPDLILVSGDIHQMENFDVAALRKVLGHLQAPLGVYACAGFDNTQVLRVAAPQLRMLENEAVVVEWQGEKIGIAGLMDSGKQRPAYDAIRDAQLRIVLNHTPDLMEDAAAHGAHLYLCGHTHGGQVRIPFWGAIITNTGTGKKYEAGLYRVGEMHGYTSRGLGLEPPPAPSVRFLCRPEITLIELLPRSGRQ